MARILSVSGDVEGTRGYTLVPACVDDRRDQELKLVGMIENAEDTIVALQKELERHKRHLHELRFQRCAIWRIPDEVLRRIFGTHAGHILPVSSSEMHDVYKDQTYQLSCAQVCRRWRKIVFETSSLWESIVIVDVSSKNFALMMINSIPSRFGLRFEPLDTSPDLDFECFMAQIPAARLIHLHVELCACWPAGRESIAQKFPNLVSVSLVRGNCNHIPLDPSFWKGHGVTGSSSVQILRVERGALPLDVGFGASLKRVSLLEVTCPSSVSLHAFLSNAPNLEHISLRDLTLLDTTAFVTNDSGKTMMNRLRTLCLSEHALSAFFSTLGMPSFSRLHELILHPGSDEASEDLQKLIRFTLEQNSLESLAISQQFGSSCTFTCNLLEAISASNSRPGLILPCLSTLTVRAPFKRLDKWESPLTFHSTLPTHLSRLIDDRAKQGCPLRLVRVAPLLSPSDRDLLKDKVTEEAESHSDDEW